MGRAVNSGHTFLTVVGRRIEWPAMARQLRIEYAGDAYHVIARGNQGKPFYADDSDRKRLAGWKG
jgi:hypothetical protein